MDNSTNVGQKALSLHRISSQIPSISVNFHLVMHFHFSARPQGKGLDHEILDIAGPSIVTNITVPLLGIVDLAIVGHLGTQAAIGAIAVGGLIFNMVYWLFNFLRMGSSGLTAQAYGRRDLTSVHRVLRMGLTVALVCGIGIFVIQRPMEWASHLIIAPTDEVWRLALEYFRVRIWAAPAVLALFAMNGWLVGMQNSRYPLLIAVGQNLINIAASYALVFWYGMGVDGVALGTVISQYAGLAAAAFLCRHELRRSIARLGLGNAGVDDLSTTYQQSGVENSSAEASQQPDVDKSAGYELSYQQFFNVNRDIFLRMICLIAVTTAFTAYGARMGDTLLAVNTLLMQLFTLFSYFSDGIALAGEALVGKYVGAQNPLRLQQVVRRLFVWGAGVMLLFTLFYLLGGPVLLSLLTDEPEVISAASPYLCWAVAIPVCGLAAFMWDGVFIGATRTREMFFSLLIGAVVFFSLRVLLMLVMNDPNDALWLAFLSYLAIRGGYLTWRWVKKS